MRACAHGAVWAAIMDKRCSYKIWTARFGIRLVDTAQHCQICTPNVLPISVFRVTITRKRPKVTYKSILIKINATTWMHKCTLIALSTMYHRCVASCTLKSCIHEDHRHTDRTGKIGLYIFVASKLEIADMPQSVVVTSGHRGFWPWYIWRPPVAIGWPCIFGGQNEEGSRDNQRMFNTWGAYNCSVLLASIEDCFTCSHSKSMLT